MGTNYQLMINTRTEATGWRPEGADQVHAGGRWRHTNGQWELEDEVAQDDLAELLPALSDVDAAALVEHAQGVTESKARQAAQESARKARQEAEESARQVQLQAWAQEQLAQLQALPVGAHQVVVGRDGWRRTYVRSAYGLQVVFVKRRGRVRWLLPCTEQDVVGLLLGTHQITYWTRSNRAEVRPVKP